MANSIAYLICTISTAVAAVQSPQRTEAVVSVTALRYFFRSTR